MGDFACGLGTHFEARIDLPSLQQVRAFNFRWARLDCQTCSTDTMLAMIEDCKACDLEPLPIVSDPDRLRALEGVGVPVEFSNEPDGDIPPAVYREQLNAACIVALEHGIELWGPAISNLDRDSLRWLEAVRDGAWPVGLEVISVHRYGDGTFDYSHEGFASRADEVAALLELCDGLPFAVTEFGYPTYPAAGVTRQRKRPKRTKYLRPDLHLSESQSAANIAQEWEFWRAYTDRPFLYQINDGPNADEGYGIRRFVDGALDGWKQAAYEVPKGEPMAGVPGNATYCISRALSFEMPGRPGEFHTYFPKGQTDTVLSVREDGHYAAMPKAEAGAFETWKPSKDGMRAVFYETAEMYAIPLVE